LDVGCFQPYKHIYKEEIERLIRGGEYTFDRQEFFFCLANVRNRALKASTIQSAWRKAGLAPPYSRETIDPVIHALDRANNRARGGARSETPVLGEALEQNQAKGGPQTPSPAGSRHSQLVSSDLETPRHPNDFLRGGEKLLRHLNGNERAAEYLGKLIQGAAEMGCLAERMSEALSETKAAGRARAARPRTTRISSQGGVVRLQDGLRNAVLKTQEQQEKEKREEEARQEREKKRRDREEQKERKAQWMRAKKHRIAHRKAIELSGKTRSKLVEERKRTAREQLANGEPIDVDGLTWIERETLYVRPAPRGHTVPQRDPEEQEAHALTILQTHAYGAIQDDLDRRLLTESMQQISWRRVEEEESWIIAGCWRKVTPPSSRPATPSTPTDDYYSIYDEDMD
jgi:hypothetical protein